ncbi:hypothetical protein A3D55_01260 [Candidatus Jorgensenbacteria bacterium RIFCSPHIGHO2_02_FULL_45_20]|uniref:Aminotransferase class IV n=1 Tax=Candidatus Jorgensenbacteria bacterium RIFCSPHIGHO2_02_FULL_45_20 TaxID=1798470 RepID=A0A1F6BN84_9BACT|nr:MAG: hypothetical protein A3D55_01260 [Candidatus Jorgensenbacteria bacterium RIFCSPHIGHO2_02_FULL_45_20]
MTKKYSYLNGKVVLTEKAKISIHDLGVMRGFGVFDSLRSYDGVPFLLDAHISHFHESARLIGLKPPVGKDEIAGIIKNLVKKNGNPDAAVRMVLTGGESDDTVTYNIETPTFFVTVEKIQTYPPEVYKKGVKIISVENERRIPNAKTTDYILMFSLQKLKREKNAFEIIYFSRGRVLEGSTFNFFIFKGNKLITPRDGVFKGETRNFTLSFAREMFKVEEREALIRELKTADEAFLTSTKREIMPVVKIDSLKIGNGKVGENTKRLMAVFRERVDEFVARNRGL